MTAPSTPFTPWRRLRDHSNRPWSLEAQMAMAIMGALLLFSLASMFYLTQASYAAWASERIREQQIEKQRLEWQQVELERDIAALTAPDALITRARALGFAPPTQTIYVRAAGVQASAPASQNPPASPVSQRDAWAELALPALSWLDEHVTSNVLGWLGTVEGRLGR